MTFSNTKYQFKSEVDGYVPIQFLDVSYKVDCDALTKEFRERLRTLDAGEVVPEIGLLPKRRAVRHQGYVH